MTLSFLLFVVVALGLALWLGYCVAWFPYVPLAVAYEAGIRWAKEPSHLASPAGPWFFFNFAVERRTRRWRWIWRAYPVVVSGAYTSLELDPFAASPARWLYDIIPLWAASLSWLVIGMMFARLGLLWSLRGRESFVHLLFAGWWYGFLFFVAFFLGYGFIGSIAAAFPFLGNKPDVIRFGVPYVILGFPLPLLAAALVMRPLRWKINEEGDRWFQFGENHGLMRQFRNHPG